MRDRRAEHVLVMAKAPVPGRVKTRLCPPCTPNEAAAIAAAALADTLDAVAACGAARRILALDGEPGEWVPSGFEVIAQRGEGLDQRLAAAWSDAGGPGVQIGMDTPQVTAALLDGALDRLLSRPGGGATAEVDAVMGPAEDGGWWAIGLHRPAAAVFLGVPMSTITTGEAQHRRLLELGLSTALLATLADIDTVADLAAVTAAHPHLRVSQVAAGLGVAA